MIYQVIIPLIEEWDNSNLFQTPSLSKIRGNGWTMYVASEATM
jgi:hypothetical protein